jgi:hypothetical protein
MEAVGVTLVPSTMTLLRSMPRTCRFGVVMEMPSWSVPCSR